MTVDEQLLEVQQWLNETYEKVDGYHHVKEDGKHTWETIYALITGLQHELGITDLSISFGPTTAKYFDQQGGVKTGDNNNKVKILMGGFLCKGAGFNPGGFDTYYEEKLEDCVVKFKSAAGLMDTDGHVDAKLMKAILNMDAYTLLGNETIRTIQQSLNRDYNTYFDLIACDGIYQRNTNTGLIYGLQSELGIDVATANGSFGPLTTSKYIDAAANSGINKYPGVIKILQYALYINTGEKLTFTGKLDVATTQAINKFETFMAIISENVGYPTITIAKGLLQSSGDSDRICIGVDTSRQLTEEMVTTIWENGYRYIGRYLTGTVGGSTPKNLTSPEIKRILERKTQVLKLFPIYQDNDPVIDYYTEEQGNDDGVIACERAFELGFMPNSIIYFAVDIDTTEVDIVNNILPYFKGISIGVNKWSAKHFGYPFQVGIYASRNACTKAREAGYSVASFVANMSTGYSGNLGFPQPTDWTFDQFAEPEEGIGTGDGNVPIDKVAVNEKDTATSEVQPAFNGALSVALNTPFRIFNATLEYTDITLSKKVTLFDIPLSGVKIEATFYDTLQSTAGEMFTFNVKNGKIDAKFKEQLTDLVGSTLSQSITDKINTISATIKEGDISFSIATNDKAELIISSVINFLDYELSDKEKVNAAIRLDITLYNTIITGIAEIVGDISWDKLVEILKPIGWIAGAVVIGGLIAAEAPIEIITAIVLGLGGLIKALI
ncbi:glycoside hydrolase domain-containing protein [Listeria sp. PSOL-1]|uniref:glycoside hydrolase domain-containing protein n=1 Tax=Listeria sp. PSOL-1 TaxID=1844999 RepID=UPI0013D83B0F|nr:glycoside hydrolase domain-containing protein [Listeria sp. PSOL-1]